MVLDEHGLDPNPPRNVRLPREEAEEMNPPTASDVEAVFWLLPSVHRLPFLWLEASGQRVAAVNRTLVGDYDERNRRGADPEEHHEDAQAGLARPSGRPR
jgi:hypothetical protein